MDADLIKSMLSVVAATIPLIITIIALLTNRIERPGVTIDNPSLKIFSIIRSPLEKEVLEEIRIYYRKKFNLIFIILILIYFSVGFFTAFISSSIFIKFSILVVDFLLFTTLFIIITSSKFYSFGKKSFFRTEICKFFFFEKVIIILEADFHYLFNKSHETLRSMKFEILNVDEGNGSLDAFRIFIRSPLITRHSTRRVQLIQLRIDNVGNSGNDYKIILEFLNPIGIPERSSITNQFINRLISKSKNIDKKG